MSKCWYCNNELTSGDNPKHFGICNKCMTIRSLTNKIADLQTQKENIIEHWNYLYKKRDLLNEILDTILKNIKSKRRKK